MSEHLSNEMLTALADGELASEELVRVEAHLAECAECTRRALGESLLKRGLARAGQRYAMPGELRERVMATVESSHVSDARRGSPQDSKYGDSGHALSAVQNHAAGGNSSKRVWMGAVAAVVLVCVSAFVAHDAALRGAQQAALVNEAVDEHIAAIAAGGPEVVSSDRHTVKPWFQGKLPFSFNLPEHLPSDVTLDGANLVQVEGQPAAQLLFSVGKHRASIFVSQRAGAAVGDAERNGFHVDELRTRELGIMAVSDADAARLRELVRAMEAAQE